MRNIPVFTTEFGVASLILKEIPYKGTAYVRLQSSLYPEKLLAECEGFCRAAGADVIYATGDASLEKFPLYTKILRMEINKQALPKTEAVACPVIPEEADRWRKLYNRAMTGVDNASYMDDLDVKQMLRQEDGYFVYMQGTQIGIGRADGDQIFVVAALVPGGGRDTVLALADKLSSERIKLEVASTNHRAIRLYERLGFAQTEDLSCWYKIL